MVVRKILPCGTARAVILAHRTPLPLGQIRPPALPMLLPGTRLFQSVVFYGLYSCHDVLDSLTIKKVLPSVVQILVTGYGPIDSSERSNAAVVIGRQRAIGSGFVIDPAGYIITNAHVVTGAQRVQVVVPEGVSDGSLQAILSARTNIVPARVVGVARDIHVALLNIDNMNFDSLPLAQYRNIHQGEILLPFCSPTGL